MNSWDKLCQRTLGRRWLWAVLLLTAYSWDFVIRLGANPRSLLFENASSHARSGVQQQQAIYRLVPDTPDTLPRFMVNKAFESEDMSLPFVDDEVSLRVKACPVTAQLRFYEEEWKLETLNESGESKFIGGDEYYIVYQDRAMYTAEAPPGNTITAVAWWHDYQNGTYSVREFVASPHLPSNITLEGTGRLVIYLTHTCGVGRIGRPHKDGWATGGGVNAKWIVENVSAPTFDSFEPADQSVDLGQYQRILGVGDSIMQQFVSSTYLKWFYPNLRFGRNMQNPLQMRTVDEFLKKISGRLKPWVEEKATIALIVGSASWDLLKPFGNEDVPIAGLPEEETALFTDHLLAARKLTTTVQRQFPSVDIYWRSGSALHLHALREGYGENWTWTTLDRIKYLSQYRAERLFHLQRDLMSELGVTFLDLYHASYLMADRHRSPGDSMHYDIPTNQMMISWFYPRGFDEGVTEALT